MARRNRRSNNSRAEVLVQAIGGFLVLISLAVGGIKGFLPVLVSLCVLVLVIAIVSGAGWIAWKILKQHRTDKISQTSIPVTFSSPPAFAPIPHTWTVAEIASGFERLDWYQFEKVNAAILQLEGWTVHRRGGASPDGGVDLIAERADEKKLIQCKHWLNWKVQEKVVRELLGSMTHMNVRAGALHTLIGCTQPAAALASQHAIELSDRDELARRARDVFSDDQLTYWFKNAPRCCPKCDGTMIFRTGNFEPFYGCKRFPRCRGKIDTNEKRAIA